MRANIKFKRLSKNTLRSLLLIDREDLSVQERAQYDQLMQVLRQQSNNQ